MEGGKSEKKKTTVSIVGGGGGIGGIVVLCGAFAVATLISVFAISNRNRGKLTKKDQSTDSDSPQKSNLNNTTTNNTNTNEEIDGLRFLIQPSSPSLHLNPCVQSNGKSEMGSAQIDSNELVSTQNLILEEQSPVLEINGEKETQKSFDHESLLSDSKNPENISLCNGKSEMGSAQIGSNELGSTQNLILGESCSVLEINGEKETQKSFDHESLLSDSKNPENISLCNGSNELGSTQNLILGESCSVLEINGGKETQTSVVEHESVLSDATDPFNYGIEKELPLPEAIEEVEKEDEACVEVDEELVEEDPLMESIQEEEEEENDDTDDDESHDYDGEEDDVERSENSSEETGDSSMESNAEAVWPTESIEKLSLALKEMNFNFPECSEDKIGDEDKTVEKNYSNEIEEEATETPMVVLPSIKETMMETVTVNYQAQVRSGKLRMMIWSILGMLMMFMILGVFINYESLSYYLVNGDSIL